jgi:hypothetical protein
MSGHFTFTEKQKFGELKAVAVPLHATKALGKRGV